MWFFSTVSLREFYCKLFVNCHNRSKAVEPCLNLIIGGAGIHAPPITWAVLVVFRIAPQTSGPTSNRRTSGPHSPPEGDRKGPPLPGTEAASYRVGAGLAPALGRRSRQ